MAGSSMDITGGNTSRLERQLQTLSPGESARDRSRSAALRHGTAELRYGLRRERSRENRGLFAPNPLGQTQLPQLPQTMLDIGARFDDVESRIDSLGRMQRTHAQSIALGDEVMTENRRRTKVLDEDSTKYKLFITGVHTAIEGHIKNQMQLVQATTDSIQQVLMTRSEATEAQLQILQNSLAS